jgi:hypothetical protein
MLSFLFFIYTNMITIKTLGESFEIYNGSKLLLTGKKDTFFITAEILISNPVKFAAVLHSSTSSFKFKVHLDDTSYDNIRDLMLHAATNVFTNFDEIAWDGENRVTSQPSFVILNAENINSPQLIGFKNDFLLDYRDNEPSFSNLKYMIRSAKHDDYTLPLNDINAVNALKKILYVKDLAYSSENFTLFDKDDPTKVLKFDLSGLDPSTTRTVQPPSKDGELVSYSNVPGEPTFVGTPNTTAYQINGIDEILQVNHTAAVSTLDKAQDFTMSFWVNLKNLTNNTEFFSFADGTSNQYYFRAQYQTSSGGRFRLYYGANNRRLDVTGISTTMLNNWVQIVFVNSVSGGYRRLYFNGIQRNTTTNAYGTQPIPTAADMKIGCLYNNTRFVNAIFDDIVFWDTDLQDADVAELWNAGLYRAPDLHSKYASNATLWMNADSEVNPDNQPVGSNLIDNVTSTYQGTFVGLNIGDISQNYVSDTP